LSTHQQSILLIEDDIGAREAFEPMLKAHGFDVRLAVDAASGVNELQRSLPDVILLDLHLQDSNGVDFLRRFRQEFPHAATPSAVITGDYMVDEHVIRDLETLGARIFFKPLWEEDLVRIVGTLLSAGAVMAQSPAQCVRE